MIRNICYNFLQITILLLNRLNITPKVDDHILGIYSLVYIISTHNFVSPKTNRDEDIVIASWMWHGGFLLNFIQNEICKDDQTCCSPYWVVFVFNMLIKSFSIKNVLIPFENWSWQINCTRMTQILDIFGLLKVLFNLANNYTT